MAGIPFDVQNVLEGVLHGNLPEIAGAAGAYVTFKDKPYAFAVTMDQIKSTALTSSITGAIMSIAQKYILKSGGNGPRRSRNRKRNKGGKKR